MIITLVSCISLMPAGGQHFSSAISESENVNSGFWFATTHGVFDWAWVRAFEDFFKRPQGPSTVTWSC